MSKPDPGSADFQSAVSQRFQPADAAILSNPMVVIQSADWKSAIEQVGNLRYFSGVGSLELGISLVLGSWMLVLFTGCAVGPNYKRPSVQSPATFRSDTAPTNKSFADLDWWNIYKDVTLQSLIREAFT